MGVSFKCLILKPHLTAYDSNIGVHIMAMLDIGTFTCVLMPLHITLHKLLYCHFGVGSGGRCGGVVGNALTKVDLRNSGTYLN